MPVRRSREGLSGWSETYDVRALPRQGHCFPTTTERVGERALQVLLEHGQAAADVEVDHRVGRGTEVDHLADSPGGDAGVVVAAVHRAGVQRDLLRPDADRS